MDQKLGEIGDALRDKINDKAYIVAKVGETWKIFANNNQ